MSALKQIEAGSSKIEAKETDSVRPEQRPVCQRRLFAELARDRRGHTGFRTMVSAI